jgi:HEAT repeat protein
MDTRRLARDLISGDVAARREAAESLAHRGSGSAAASLALIRAAADEDEEVAEWSVAALEDLGPPCEADLPGLAELLTHTPADTAYWAATLIGRSEAAAATCTGPLSDALQNHRETAVRERIAWALGRIGPAASAAAATIEALASEPNCPPRLARACREALQSIRPPETDAPSLG